MPTLTQNKKYWYKDIFGIAWPQKPNSREDDDSKASLVVEEIGTFNETKVHLTVFRDAWQYRFRHDTPTPEILERIFGSGSGGIHVTLETDPPRHCYRGGANEGATPDEKKKLAELLQGKLELFAETIERSKRSYDAFEWKDCDDPADRFEFLFSNVQVDGFQRMADMAGGIHKAHVLYPAQMDSALVWSTASIHPMQPLQNTHQRHVAEICRGLSGDALQATGSAVLGQYYYFKAITPEPMGRPKDDKPTLEEELREVEATLKTLKWLIDDAAPTLEIDLIKKYLETVHKKLKRMRSIFFSLPEWTGSQPEDQNARERRAQGHHTEAERVPALIDTSNRLGRFYRELQALENKPRPQSPPPDPLTRGEQLERCEKMCTHLQRAHHELGRALTGVCCIQNFHTIEPFYLFRLMVRFQIRSEQAIPSGLRTKVSSTLTGLLHNSPHMEWLFTWLRDKLVELDMLLKKACPDRGPKTDAFPDGEPAFVFYLKGGRAAKYLAELPKSGENDWDTNIVINPNLSAGEWYRVFLLVHNTILRFTERAKRELLIQMHQPANYGDFLAALDETQEKIDQERQKSKQPPTSATATSSAFSVANVLGLSGMVLGVATLNPWIFGISAVGLGLVNRDLLRSDREEESLEQTDRQIDQAEAERSPGLELTEVNKESCKAELIDIGIPRRGTIEAFTGWYHVCPHVITCSDQIPIPGHLYYIAEYVLMIREAFIGQSRSINKTPKRVVRLHEVLEMSSLDERVAQEKTHIPRSSLAGSIRKVDSQADPLRRMLTILLAQFTIAYDLDIDADLAKCFDAKFTGSIESIKRKANYPSELTSSIQEYKKEGSTYATKHEDLADGIGYAQWLAQEIDAHLRDERAKFIQKQRAELFKFTKAIYTGTFFHLAQEETFEKYNVQFAVTGAFAAMLYAEDAEFERPEELEPPRRLDLALYAAEGSDPATMLELIEPCVDAYIKKSTNIQYTKQKHGQDSLCLFWPAPEKFSENFSYKPLMIKITAVVHGQDRPSRAFVRGLPLLSLRDLIGEYKRRAGYVEESFTQEGLRVATDALTEILTRFENPNVGSLPKVKVQAPPLGPTSSPSSSAPPSTEGEGEGEGEDEVVVTKEVPDFTFIGQRRANWCWAAASLMMRRFYLADQSTLEQVVKDALGKVVDSKHSLSLSRLRPKSPVENHALDWDAIQRAIDAEKPFIFGNAGHYYVCYGYEVRGPRRSLLVWDPLGEGAKIKKSYADYQRTANNGATAHDFTIVERTVLLPIQLHAPDFPSGREDFRLRVTPQDLDPALEASRYELRVRIAENIRGEPGAVIFSQSLTTLPQPAWEWDGTVEASHHRSTRVRAEDSPLLVELQVTLENTENRTPSTENTQIPLQVT